MAPVVRASWTQDRSYEPGEQADALEVLNSDGSGTASRAAAGELQAGEATQDTGLNKA